MYIVYTRYLPMHLLKNLDESLKLNEINHHYTMLIYFSFLVSKVKI